jgi:hypothetical protein
VKQTEKKDDAHLKMHAAEIDQNLAVKTVILQQMDTFEDVLAELQDNRDVCKMTLDPDDCIEINSICERLGGIYNTIQAEVDKIVPTDSRMIKKVDPEHQDRGSRSQRRRMRYNRIKQKIASNPTL